MVFKLTNSSSKELFLKITVNIKFAPLKTKGLMAFSFSEKHFLGHLNYARIFMMLLGLNGDAISYVSCLFLCRSSERHGPRYKWRASSCNAAWKQ